MAPSDSETGSARLASGSDRRPQGAAAALAAGRAGVVGTVPLGRITEEWGVDYAGWASSINGYTIRGLAEA